MVTKQTLSLVVLLGLPVLVGCLLLWELHTPSPAVRTPVVINRNALLPHDFAGPCINCHRIAELGPTELNTHNMLAYNLTARERELVDAGQRVVLPTVAMRIRTPAILRDDLLPHSYVGVCSNCHVVLDVRPSASYFDNALASARTPLPVFQSAHPGPTVDGSLDHHGFELREDLRSLFGFVSLVLFFVSAVYVVMRILLRRDPKRWRGRLDLKKWIKIHEWTSVGVCLSAMVHWHYSDRGNNFLHVSVLVLFWLAAAGFTMRARSLSNRSARKGVRLVHTQRYLFVGLIVLLVLGHVLVDVH